MKNLILVLLPLFLFSIFLNSCTDYSSTDKLNEMVNTHVDLHSGFQNNSVLLKYQEKILFNEKLSSTVPLSGPLATFTTYLSKGNNIRYFSWGLDSLSNSDSIEFTIDESEMHYIGISVYNDTLTFQIQKTEFIYL